MSNRLVVLALLVASSALPGRGQAPAAEQQFKRMDRNGDGKIVREELPEGAQRNFERIDRDRDGFISPEEHAAFLRARASQGPAIGTPRIPDSVEFKPDLAYAGTDNPRQKLDLLLPKARTNPLPVVVFIHGGAWRAGDKRQALSRIAPYVESGRFAGASIAYRLTDEAQWPSQIHDCKAAIRWLKAHAKEYGLDPDRIAVWGSSAGGHLVAMLGTSGDVKELEGDLGGTTGVSSRVAAVVDFCGPADFVPMMETQNSMDHRTADSPEGRLLGGTAKDRPEVARSASPVTHATKDDPPFLIVHGSADNTVPFDQSVRMDKALREAGTKVPPVFIKMDGGGHGFGSPELDRRVRQFLDLHLLGIPADISAEPIAVSAGGGPR